MIATPDQRNRLMQKLKAETCIRRKNGIGSERNGRNESKKRSSLLLGTLSPDPWDFSLLMPIPVDDFVAGAQLNSKPAPAWSWPRSRRSGCFPAEPYPPLRPLVVYPVPAMLHKMEQKRLDYRSAFRHVA